MAVEKNQFWEFHSLKKYVNNFNSFVVYVNILHTYVIPMYIYKYLRHSIGLLEQEKPSEHIVHAIKTESLMNAKHTTIKVLITKLKLNLSAEFLFIEFNIFN